MRRTFAAAGAITVLAPLLLAGASDASAAAKGSLTVTTIDRHGKSVSASELQVYNPATGDIRTLESKKAVSLPDGTYDIATLFENAAPSDGVNAGARTVKVSGTTKVTFDARQGHAVNVSLSPNPGSGYDHQVAAYICTADNGPLAVGDMVEAGQFSVIPSSSKDFTFAYGTAYESTAATGGDVYLASATRNGGVPSGMSATLKRSGLTALKISARSGTDSGEARFAFEYQSSGGNDCSMWTNQLHFYRDLPNHVTVHVPPGQWSAEVEGYDWSFDGFHHYAAGRTTSLTFGHAVRGPGGTLPYTWEHRLSVGDINPFADPTLPGGDTLATSTLKLSHSGRTIYSGSFSPHHDIPTATPSIPGRGWYTLSEVARRGGLPSGSLSTTSSLTLHFYADPSAQNQVRDYITRFWPDGLDVRNQAAPGSTTTVALGMQHDAIDDSTVGRPSDSVKSVRAWYSTNGGSTWHATTVKHSGGTWSTAVHNPDSGRVALRSTVTDTHGDSSTTTVYNAYAVS